MEETAGNSTLVDEEVDRVMPRRREDLFLLPCGSDVMVHDDIGSQVHALNEIAATILNRCDGTTPLVDVAAGLQEEYDVSREQLLQDMEVILRNFRDTGLLA